MSAIEQAFGLVFQWNVLGAIPGLTATMAIALLVPVTFFMDPVPAVGAMVACSAMAIFAGDIPATLLRMPGTPSSAAYTDEAYAMTVKGEAELALGANLLFSALGGLFGTAVLILAAPYLAEVALKFSSFEYFWMALLGLTCAAFIGAGSPLKGAVSLLIGNLFTGWGRMIVVYWRQQIRGNVLGVVIGILPGAGADIAAWVAYAVSK